MVVATLRDDELSSSARHWLAELERRPKVRRLRLAPLTQAEIGEVVADLMPADASEDAKAAGNLGRGGHTAVRQGTGRRLARPWCPPRSRRRAGQGGRCPGPSPGAVIDQVWSQTEECPDGLLAATVTLPEARLLAAARAAVDLRPSRLRWRRIRLHAHTGPPGHLRPDSPGERRRLHRRLAAALADQPGSDPGLLARHWHLAGSPDRAADAAVVAARHGGSVAPSPEAAKNYGLAIELAELAAGSWAWPAGGGGTVGGLGGRSRAGRHLGRGRARPVDAAAPSTGLGGFSGSGVTGGRWASPRRPPKPRSRPCSYSNKSRRPGFRLAS